MKRSRFSLWAVLIGTLFLCACSSAPVAPEQSYMQTKSDEASAAGYSAYSSGDYRKALEKFRESLRINRSIDNRRAEFLDLINIGRTEIALGEYANAKKYLNEGIRLGSTLKDDKNLSEAYATLAKADYLSGDAATALGQIEKSLSIDQRLGVKSGAKLNLKGLIYAETGRKDEAQSVLKAALDINREAKNGPETANSYRAMAELYRISRDLDGAIELYEQAYAIDKSAGMSRRIALDLEKMAELRLEQGKAEDAVFLLERSYIVSLNAGRHTDALVKVEKLIKAYRGLGNENKAVYYTNMRNGLLGQHIEGN